MITTAFEDATFIGAVTSTDRVREIDEAKAFLTASSGDHAEARRLWCEAADVCPNRLRTRTLLALQAIADRQRRLLAAFMDTRLRRA